MNSQNKLNRRLGLESLETRELMAGNVALTLDYNGTLIVKGDDYSNGVEIKNTDPSAGIYQVRGFTQDGANTVINGSSLITYARGVHNIVVDGYGGNDYLWVGSSVTNQFFKLTGGLSIYGENGDDSIVVQNVEINFNLEISTGNGRDTTYVYQ